MSARPQLVAVVGGSGSGKSWLADQLRKRIGKEAGRISLDEFYRDRSHLAPGQRERINYDHPRVIDWERVSQFLEDCRSGCAVRVPKYDFASHSRLQDQRLWRPRRLVLMDGLWLLRRPSLRRLFALRIFLDCPERLRLQRRIARDAAERGRNEASVRKQFAAQVAPMHARYVRPQIRWADIVLTAPPGERELDQLTEQVRRL